MRATEKDIPVIAKQWYELKEKTCFGGLDIEWSLPLCSLYLQEHFSNPLMYLAVEKRDHKVIAACGAVVINLITPPHPLVVTEFLWTGTGKPAARVWKECRTWGKSKGAILAHCAIGTPNKNKKKFTETYQWRAL